MSYLQENFVVSKLCEWMIIFFFKLSFALKKNALQITRLSILTLKWIAFLCRFKLPLFLSLTVCNLLGIHSLFKLKFMLSFGEIVPDCLLKPSSKYWRKRANERERERGRKWKGEKEGENERVIASKSYDGMENVSGNYASWLHIAS